ncbi:MAG: hypothetical protein R3F42_01450 [Pseudomonadota bacterium]
MTHLLTRAIQKLRSNPRYVLEWATAALRGTAYAVFFRLFRRQVRIQLPFLVSAPVSIQGPGAVFIGRGCAVRWNVFDGLNITTLSADAKVEIGPRCNLGGITIRCKNRVTIGAQAMFANCLVQDTPFWSRSGSHSGRASAEPAVPEGITLGSQSWLSSQTVALDGCHVGDESVLSLGAVCCRQRVPSRHVAFGNPVDRFLSIERIENLLRVT